MQPDGMSAKDREQLALLVRRREKHAKSAAKARAAQLMADVEEQLATIHRADDERWRAIVEQANAVVAQADAEVARICRETGVPEDFRPGLNLSWYGRGDNASAARRGELRKVAGTRIAALEQQASSEIERRSLQVQTALVEGGLSSSVGRAFLATMPSAEALMPGLEGALPLAGRRLKDGYDDD